MYSLAYLYRSINGGAKKEELAICIVICVIDSAAALITCLIDTRIRHFIPLFLIPCLSLIVIIAITRSYMEGFSGISSKDVFLFCGDYLCFLGTFGMGYFIYAKGKINSIEEQREYVKRLLVLIDNTLNYFRKIAGNMAVIVDEKQYAIIELKGNTELSCNHDKWLDYYLEVERLNGKNEYLEVTLNNFFNTAKEVNELVKNKAIDKASTVINNYFENIDYSIQRYNIYEAYEKLLNIYFDRRLKNLSWLEKKETCKHIDNICKSYYYIIENYIYVWLLKNNVKEADSDLLMHETAEWLLFNSQDIKNIVKDSTDKRIICRAIFDCSLKFSRYSKRIDFIWGQYSLREND